MKKMIISSLMAFGLAVSSAQAAPLTYTLDTSHTSIEFYVNHLGFSNFQGEFQKFKGNIIFDQDNPQASSVDVRIYPHSIDTDVEALDNALESEQFFNAQAYPVIDFKSKSIRITGDKTGEVIGDLTMHGVTKEIVLKTTLNKAAMHPMLKKPAVGFSAVGKIKRSDFGITRYIPAVGDEVTIRIETEAQVQ